jgi:hypothetical protein
MCAGGPDSQMQAAYYSSRMNYANVLGCTTYPCSRYLYPPATPSGSVTYASERERNASLAGFRVAAENEYRLEELLLQVEFKREWVSLASTNSGLL